MKHLISIIIPVYNVQDYISDCLRSIFPQVLLYDNTEVVIIDDGSKDQSIDIVNQLVTEYGLDEKVRVIRQGNIGLSGARNTGIKVAAGDFLAFIDSDDLVSSDYLEKLNKVIDINPCVEIIKFQYLFFKTNPEHNISSKKEVNFVSHANSVDYYQSEIVDNSWYAWRRIYARHLFDEHLFDVGKKYEDVLLIPLITLLSKASIEINNVLIYYRSNPNGITKRSSLNCAKDILCSIDEQLIVMEQHNIKSLLRKKYLINTILTFVNTVAVSNSGWSKITFIQNKISIYYPFLSHLNIVYIWSYFTLSQCKSLLSSIKRML